MSIRTLQGAVILLLSGIAAFLSWRGERLLEVLQPPVATAARVDDRHTTVELDDGTEVTAVRVQIERQRLLINPVEGAPLDVDLAAVRAMRWAPPRPTAEAELTGAASRFVELLTVAIGEVIAAADRAELPTPDGGSDTGSEVGSDASSLAAAIAAILDAEAAAGEVVHAADDVETGAAAAEAELTAAIRATVTQAQIAGGEVVHASPALMAPPGSAGAGAAVAIEPTPSPEAKDPTASFDGPPAQFPPPRPGTSVFSMKSASYRIESSLGLEATRFYAAYAESLRSHALATDFKGMATVDDDRAALALVHDWDDFVRLLRQRGLASDEPPRALQSVSDYRDRTAIVHGRDTPSTARALAQAVVRVLVGDLCARRPGVDPLVRRPAWLTEAIVVDLVERYLADARGGLIERDPEGLRAEVRALLTDGGARGLTELVQAPAGRLDRAGQVQAWSLYRFLATATPRDVGPVRVTPSAALGRYLRALLERPAPTAVPEAHYRSLLEEALGVDLETLQPAWRAFVLDEL